MAAALALALTPILVFGALETGLTYHREGLRRQSDAVAASARPGLIAWVAADPLTTLALPLLSFGLTLAAVFMVAERGGWGWISQLQGVADGAGSERPEEGAHTWRRAPPEVRRLAGTIGALSVELEARDVALQESHARAEALVREVHHRVKNNLQIISSLVNMQQRALTDPVARAALVSTRNHISALAMISRASLGADLHQVNVQDFLEDLLAQLVHGGVPPDPDLDVELQAVPMMLEADRLAPLALFVVEAITNARKHGLAKAGGRLRVVFGVEDACAHLAVSDDGSGGSSPTIGPGIGRRLMTAFGRQLHGKVSFEPNVGGGLTAELAFPVGDGPPDSSEA